MKQFKFRSITCGLLGALLLLGAAAPLTFTSCENEHPEIIENYDYWSVPSLFIDHDKIFEAALFMPYETVKEGVKLAFDKALEE